MNLDMFNECEYELGDWVTLDGKWYQIEGFTYDDFYDCLCVIINDGISIPIYALDRPPMLYCRSKNSKGEIVRWREVIKKPPQP